MTDKPDSRESHPSMTRPKHGAKRPAQWFLHNTRPLEIPQQWTAYPTKAQALTAAQKVIDQADAQSWLWIEDGALHVAAHAKADWTLTIYEGFDAAMAATASPDANAQALSRAVLGLVEAGKVPEYRALPKPRRTSKPKPLKS